MLRRPVSCPSQARLLHTRGDLRGTRTHFKVRLAEPSPIVRPGELHCKAEAQFAQGGCGRTGMELKRAPSGRRLLVTEVDKDWRRKTPAARWNYQEEQQAHRGDYEYSSHAIHPGDRIRAVNDLSNATGMLGALEDAGSYTIPKKLNLEISRDIADVLQPLQSPRVKPQQLQPPRLPSNENHSPNLNDMAPRPPRVTTQLPWSPPSDLKRPGSGDEHSDKQRTRGRRPPVDPGVKKLSPPSFARPWSGDECSTRSPSISSREASVMPSRRSASNGPRLRKELISASSPVLTQAGLVAASSK